MIASVFATADWCELAEAPYQQRKQTVLDLMSWNWLGLPTQRSCTWNLPPAWIRRMDRPTKGMNDGLGQHPSRLDPSTGRTNTDTGLWLMETASTLVRLPASASPP